MIPSGEKVKINSSLVAFEEPFDGNTAFLTAIRNQELDIASVLLDKGADINAIDNCGFSALHHVAMRNNLETMAFLLEAGANPNVADSKGRTQLHLQVRFGSKPTIGLLISFGAEVTPNIYNLILQ